MANKMEAHEKLRTIFDHLKVLQDGRAGRVPHAKNLTFKLNITNFNFTSLTNCKNLFKATILCPMVHTHVHVQYVPCIAGFELGYADRTDQFHLPYRSVSVCYYCIYFTLYWRVNFACLSLWFANTIMPRGTGYNFFRKLSLLVSKKYRKGKKQFDLKHFRLYDIL